MFEAVDLRRLLDAAPMPLRAMIFLGANAGLGNEDCGRLKQSHLDLDSGWLDYPRPKTAVQRRCPLWDETVEALREAIAKRPKPKDPADEQLVFLTRHGLAWARDTPGSPLVEEMRKLLDRVDCAAAKEAEERGEDPPKKLYRPGLGFYALRHGFETIAGESRDQPAVDHVMGHSRNDTASAYRERISDERLLAVVETVRKWLFPKAPKKRRRASHNKAKR